ncbi:hypothetical protein AB0I84_17710 [Streptomyces spectabilis]|uniref:hypothetical protein n=1 Tax=Streptomyces spectabilis TaxID=68270 RepID=UPI00341167B1
MMQDETKIPPGPPGTSGMVRNPGELLMGDRVHFDGQFFPILDMVSTPSGGKILHFDGHRPYTVNGPTLIYRRINLTERADSLRCVSTE